MTEEKILSLIEGEEFAAAMAEAETPEQLQAKLEERGITISAAEARSILSEGAESDELSAEDLENVAGGAGVALWLLKALAEAIKWWRKMGCPGIVPRIVNGKLVK